MSSGPQQPERPSRRRNENHLERISGRTTFLLVVLVGFILHVLQWVLLPFVIAGLLAYLCALPVEWLAARTGLPRAVFAVAAFLVFVLVCCVLSFVAIPHVVQSFEGVTDDFRRLIENLAREAIGNGSVNLLGQSMNASQLADAAVTGLRDWIARADMVAALGGAAFAGLFAIPLTLVLFLYFLVDGPKIKSGLLWLAPPRERPLVERIWSRLDPVLRRYFVGVVAVVVYASTAAYIGLGIFLNAPHPLLLAVMTGFLELIPVVGPGAAAVIAGLAAIRNATGIGAIILYAVYATALRLSIDQFFGPLALGAAAKLHPTLIMFSFLVGGVLYGMAGVIMAVPVALTIKTALTILYDDLPASSRAQ